MAKVNHVKEIEAMLRESKAIQDQELQASERASKHATLIEG